MYLTLPHLAQATKFDTEASSGGFVKKKIRSVINISETMKASFMKTAQ